MKAIKKGSRLRIGAEIEKAGGVHFRVWALKHQRVEVVLEAGPGAVAAVALEDEGSGHFAGQLKRAGWNTVPVPARWAR